MITKLFGGINASSHLKDYNTSVLQMLWGFEQNIYL